MDVREQRTRGVDTRGDAGGVDDHGAAVAEEPAWRERRTTTPVCASSAAAE